MLMDADNSIDGQTPQNLFHDFDDVAAMVGLP
jgi:hypothetical protein